MGWRVAAAVGLLLIAFVAFLALIDLDRLREPIARRASQALGREVSIGRLEGRLLSLRPEVTARTLRIGNPRWAGESPMAEVERLTVGLELLQLLRGDVVFSVIELERPVIALFRDDGGRANWTLGSRPREPRKEPLELPTVRRLHVDDGHVRYVDEKRGLRFAGIIEARERQGAPQAQSFRLAGQGEMNGEALRVEFRGGSLLEAQPDEAYPFEAHLVAGDTVANARGSLAGAFDFSNLRAGVDLKGEDLGELYELIGVTLPNSPPYKLSGTLSRRGMRFELAGLAGMLGDSDLHGIVALDLSGERPRLSADLASASLDFDDLAAAFGAPPSVRAGETASKEQRAVAARLAANQRLLPDANLRADRLRAMDATVRFRAAAVKARRLRMREVALDLALEDGVLTAKPFTVEFPQGRISATVRLDGRGKVPVTSLDARITGVEIEKLFTRKEDGPAPFEGTLQGRLKLEGRGDSVRAAAANADGSATLVIPSGEIREAFAELTGINVARGLGLVLTGDKEQTGLRCGVADFMVRDGRMQSRTLLVDTDDVLITGEGGLDLREERFDLKIRGRPKEFRILRVRAPVAVQGPIRKPSIGLEASGRTAAQAGAAAAIGTLVAPLAAVLAFVDPGLAEDANCGALLAQAKARGAPLRAAEAPPAKVSQGGNAAGPRQGTAKPLERR